MEKHTGKKIATFKERFNILCDENPMSDVSIAGVLNVSKQTISAWKNGTRSPKTPTVIPIAMYFNVNLSWLLGFDVERTTFSSEEDCNEENKIHLDIQHFASDEKPKTEEARIISAGIDKMSPERREQALKVLQTIFSEYFDGGESNGT